MEATRSMSTEPLKMQPWQVFHAAGKHLTNEGVARIFNREKRSAYSWGQDPACTEHRCQSPLELLHNLFVRMDAVGVGYVARSAIRYLESALDPVEPPPIIEPLPTIQEEILADYTAVAALQQVINAGGDMEQVQQYKQDAIEEIERTVDRYARGRG